MKKSWIRICSAGVVIAVYIIMAAGSEGTSTDNNYQPPTQEEEYVEINNDFSEEEFITEGESVPVITNKPEDEDEFNDYYTDFSMEDIGESN